MISGWVGTGLNDTAIVMLTPRQKLRLRAGGYPLVRTLRLSVPFPTRAISERQTVIQRDGVDARNDYGWLIEYQRDDAYGSALVELNTADFPLLIETCPHVMVANDEPTADATVQTIEMANQTLSFTSEPECVGLAVVDD